MTADDVMEMIKRLPSEEQQKVVAYIKTLKLSEPVSDEFKQAASEMFTTNAELFRKLAGS